MKKKKKNQARKSITAVGAVVAAGITPGVVTGTPPPQSPSTDIEFTAADAVSINGDVFDFDELFAMNPVDQDQTIVVVYGPPQPKQDKKKKDKDKKTRDAEIADSLNQERLMQAERARIEAMRQDSIRRAMEEHKTVYGPPPPRIRTISPEELRAIASDNKEAAIDRVAVSLLDFCSQMPQFDFRNRSLEECDIIRDMKMEPDQLESLQQQIESSCGVLVTEDMLKQLGTLRRIATFVVEVATPIKKD
jgi:hypothetical protein